MIEWSHSSDAATDKSSEPSGPKQVLKNNELMKFVLDPYYTELRRLVQEEPQNRQEWQSLYYAVGRLTEATNLLYFREGKPYMQSPEWQTLVAESRTAGEALSAAVLKRDFLSVTAGYHTLIQSCNNCHQKFEPNKPTAVNP